MPIRTLATGLTQIGRYALGRKQQERVAREKLDLEKLRDEAWHRRLREEQKGRESLRKMLVERDKFTQQEQTTRYDISQREQTVRSREIQDRMREESERKGKEFDIEMGMRKTGTWTAPKSKTLVDTRLKQLNEFRRLRDLYSGKIVTKYDEWGEKTGTERVDPNPEMVKYYDKLIQDLSEQITGTQFQQPISPQIQQQPFSYEQKYPGYFPKQQPQQQPSFLRIPAEQGAPTQMTPSMPVEQQQITPPIGQQVPPQQVAPQRPQMNPEVQRIVADYQAGKIEYDEAARMLQQLGIQ